MEDANCSFADLKPHYCTTTHSAVPTPKLKQADEEIRTLDPLLGKEMLYH